MVIETIANESTKFLYFAYGSNLLQDRIRIQNPSAVRKTTGVLKVSKKKKKRNCVFYFIFSSLCLCLCFIDYDLLINRNKILDNHCHSFVLFNSIFFFASLCFKQRAIVWISINHHIDKNPSGMDQLLRLPKIVKQKYGVLFGKSIFVI